MTPGEPDREADPRERAPARGRPGVFDLAGTTSRPRATTTRATGQEFSSVYRSQLLDNNINHYLAVDHGKLTLADLINAMGNAGTQDLRGVEVLPYALRIIGHPRDPSLAAAVPELRNWVASGAHRINRQQPGASGDYDQTDAVRIMDAWWPLLVKAELQPVLGSKLLAEVEDEFPINDQPGHGTSGAHLGSALGRRLLRNRAEGPACSAPHARQWVAQPRVLRQRVAASAAAPHSESSLRQAIAESPQQVYPADKVCAAGDQMCSDSIQFRAIGAITQPLIPWVNRPTFQQADELLGYRPG